MITKDQATVKYFTAKEEIGMQVYNLNTTTLEEIIEDVKFGGALSTEIDFDKIDEVIIHIHPKGV